MEPARHGVLAGKRGQRGRPCRLRHVLTQEQEDDAEATRARWEHYRDLPPTKVGVGTLICEAKKADPSFRQHGSALGHEIARRLAADKPKHAADDEDIEAGYDRWNEQLHRNDRGEARDIIHNVTLILRMDDRFKGRLRWNEMLEAVEAQHLPWRKGGWQPMDRRRRPVPGRVVPEAARLREAADLRRSGAARRPRPDAPPGARAAGRADLGRHSAG